MALPSLLDCLWLCLAAAIAGGVNALAGGGTLLTFPALVAVFGPGGTILANGTSTVALAPASLSSAWAYRQDLAKEWRWLKLLILPSLVGGLVGTWIVTTMEERYFNALIPWLIFGASVLFALQPLLTKKKTTLHPDQEEEKTPPHSPLKLIGIVVFQFFVAVYGGYFGAGIGILMLSGLGLIGLKNLHEMNAIKTVLAGCINGMSVAVFTAKYFLGEPTVHWPLAGLMMVSGIIGGYVAATYGRRLKPIYIRYFVIGMGFLLSGYFFFGQWQKATQFSVDRAVEMTASQLQDQFTSEPHRSFQYYGSDESYDYLHVGGTPWTAQSIKVKRGELKLERSELKATKPRKISQIDVGTAGD